MSYTVNAEWDPKARVWVATSENVPGLVAEAESLDALSEILAARIPELLEANGGIAGAAPAFRLVSAHRAVQAA